MSKQKPAEGHHPAKKPIEVEQSILDSKAALATSPDKEKEQQAYPNALTHDTAQESLDNATGLQEQQPANPPAVAAPPPAPAEDHGPLAKQVQDEVKASTDLATAKKEDLVGKPPVILASDHERPADAKTVDFGKAGKLKIENLGMPQYGVAGAEYPVTIRVAEDRTVTLQVPGDLIK